MGNFNIHNSDGSYIVDLGDWKWKLTIYIFNSEKLKAENVEFVVRLRGLPFTMTYEDILQFFGEKLLNSCPTFFLM